jgi:hypothetical protein
MTTAKIAPTIVLTSSNTAPELWLHPTLDLYAFPKKEIPTQEALLYTTPSTFGEIYDADDLPRPTSAANLPDIQVWVMAFATNFLEILAGRRQPAQLHARCHRVIYGDLLRRTGSIKEIGRIRKIHLSQPLDGICECVITVRFGERLRSLVIRSEGVDGRWLCTALDLI